VYLLFVVVNAAIGGTAPALVAALTGFLAVNWYFTPPIHTWTIAKSENVIALAAYLITAAIVSGLVAVATRRTAEAARASAEAQTLSALATGVVEADPLPILLSHLRRSFGLAGVALLRRTNGSWAVEAADGTSVDTPEAADDLHAVGSDLTLALSGGDLAAEDRRVLNAFAANLSAALDRRRLHTQTAQAAALADANELRSALLQAVSHDLRTPLAGIKASVNSLRQPDVTWTPEETAEFLKTVEDETDRLTNLVDNLLDMSRIHADAVAPVLRPTTLDEVVPAALASLGPRARDVVVDVPEAVPPVEADPALLERVVANLVDNALTHAHSDCPVHVEAGVAAGHVLLRVVDRGKGIPVTEREQIFHPFQRLDDTEPRSGAGVGLGLAVAHGFARAIGAELTVEDTPGGGTTMIVELKART
jgi:two-component system sensor histidine kinase KdpD